jgi:DNA-binding NarL/FixJ family response regulator
MAQYCSMNLQIKNSLKVYVVEDSPAVRETLYAMLSDIPGVKVIGYAADEAAAIEGIALLLPDVVILDLHLLYGTGFNVLTRVKKHQPEIKVVVLSNYASAMYVSGCKQAGADFFFDKSFQFMLVGKVLAQLMSPDGTDGEIAGLQ